MARSQSSKSKDVLVKPNATIQSFFNGTAKVKKKIERVSCPMCKRMVDLNKINDHMDSEECSEQDDIETVTLEDNDEKHDDKAQVLTSLKRKLCDNEDSNIDDNKKLKSENPVIEEKSEDVFNDGDDDLIAELFDENSSNFSPSQQSNSSEKENLSQSSQTIKLSRSISYNPSQFGGLHNLSPSPEAKVIHSGTKRASQKYRKTPTKEKRNLFGGSLPEMPQHDPFTPRKRLNPDYVPYYVTNFEYVIGCVIDCTDDKNLFTDEELDMIDSYRALSLEARKLYVRLFNRKHAWISQDKIRYDEIPDVQKTAQELTETKFLEPKEQLCDLNDLLHLLHAGDIKVLAKDFNCGSKSSNKTELILELLKMSRRKSGFFQTANTLESKMVKKGKSLVGSCYKLNPSTRSPLLRVLCLWGLNSWWESREEGGTPSTLTSILLTNQGHVTYPCYNINRVAKIFRNRGDLIAFEESVKIEDKIEQAVMNKDFDVGYSIYKSILMIYENFDPEYIEHVTALPIFLQRYSALAVIIVGLNKAVDLLEKMKKHGEAVELIRKLIANTVLDRYRGYWYERLSLDLDSHLKQPEEALVAVEAALNDPKVRVGRRLLLVQRAVKICRTKRYNLSAELERFSCRDDWDCPTAEELPTVNISGKMLNREGLTGKSVFQVPESEHNDVVTYCSVEEFCLQHYSTVGLGEGLHAEGAVFNSLLGLLFWEIIYADVPDAFRDPGQALPLDWDSDHFYLARKERIDVRLAELRGMEREEMASEVVAAWLEHSNIVSLVSWNMFPTEDKLRGMVMCFDPVSLAAVMERMLADHRSTRSGLPDLTVWNSVTRELRCVEVKGPGDRLSTKQILWVRFLNSVGVETEVCHVLPLGSKGGLSRSPVKKKSPAKRSPEKKYSPEKSQTEVKGSVPVKETEKEVKVRGKRKKTKVNFESSSVEEKVKVDENKNQAPLKKSSRKRVKRVEKVESDDDFVP